MEKEGIEIITNNMRYREGRNRDHHKQHEVSRRKESKSSQTT